jgi:hypothetical protein
MTPSCNQYSETNVMHFLFNLLRIKGLCIFRALLAHPQVALHKWHLVYCVRVMSFGCTRIEGEASILVQQFYFSLTYTGPRILLYAFLSKMFNCFLSPFQFCLNQNYNLI